MPTPVLILSDSPTGPTGLGRITRELAQHIHDDLPEVRIGVAGLNACSSRHIPYPLYPFQLRGGWDIEELPRIWDDFAGAEKGIVLTIWNISWLDWLTKPDESAIGQFLQGRPFKKWAYVPIDGACASGKLHPKDEPILRGFDRLLAYGAYGAGVIGKTLRVHNAEPKIDSIPHGIDDKIFFPREKADARKRFTLPQDLFLIGVVATNTGRKDWPLAFATLAHLRKQGINAALWCHTDEFKKHWDLTVLAEIHGVQENIIITTVQFTDENMSWFYAACDVTIGIGSGEGFGLPIAESLACGVPCITGCYAAATDYVPNEMLVSPLGWRTDGLFAIERPIFDVGDVIEQIDIVRKSPRTNMLPERLFWRNLWPVWKNWIKEGL